MSENVESTRIIMSMRNMAWCRVKGELESMLHTYWTGHKNGDNHFAFRKEVDRFINRVEFKGLQE